MRIGLIYPNIGRKGDSLFLDGARMEPLGPAVIAGITPPDAEVKIYDDRLEEMPYDEPFDLVAISVQIFTARRSYEIAAEFRKRGVPVALGGVHVTLAPEEATEHGDVVILGDAELSWPKLVEDLRRGALEERYGAGPAGSPREAGICGGVERSEAEALAGICPDGPVWSPQGGALPRRDLFAGKKYLPITLLQYSRGCTNRCSFCASSVYFQKHRYTRNVGEVVREIEAQERRLLFFVDDNIVADKEGAKELFRALIPLKIRWVSQASMDMLDDGELMDLMVKSGCLGHVVGFESISADGLAAMDKTTNKGFIADGYEYAVKELRRYGLQTWAAFTLGHDTDTLESIQETCAFAMRNKFTFAAFNILYPYPGTGLYKKLEMEGRLLYDGKWWLHPDYRFNYATFVPKNMSPDELTEVAFRCRRTFNSPRSIMRRAFEPRTNMGSPYRLLTYMLYNPLFRREMFKKQGMTFGYEEGGR